MPDGIYHVTSRGLERRDIVRDDRDRRKWAALLDVAATRHGWRILAWVLMNNHFHLFLRTPKPNLSSGMHDLNSGYVSCFNRRHGRNGPLLRGRFHAVLVERDYHYWELSRYIHLNPVRAGLADRPESFVWGSCRFYFHERGAPTWLAWDEVLSAHGASLREARGEYWRFLAEGASSKLSNPLDSAMASVLYGSQAFVERVRSWLTSRPPTKETPAPRKLRKRVGIDEIEATVCRKFGVSADTLRQKHKWHNEALLAVMYLSRKLTTTPVAELGTRFGGVKSPAVSSMVGRAAAKRQSDKRFGGLLKRCEMALSPQTQITRS